MAAKDGDEWKRLRTRRARARTLLAARLSWPAPCARCGKQLQPGDRWILGHRISRDARPDLMWEPSNWQVECPKCSNTSGARHTNRKARGLDTEDGPAFSAPEASRRPPPRYFPYTPPGIGPRFFSDPHPDAAGSLADAAGPWLDEQGVRLRPWQADVLRRALEVDGSGRLCWRTVVVSTPRQAGKSWLVKAAAMFRAAHPDLFGGEPQTVVHVANKHLAARRIHSQAWGWAERCGLAVRTAQGQERIVWPDGGSWDALTLSSVYGSSAGLVLLDEVWDVSPEDYREGLRPTQVARAMPQLWALSTAHRRSTGLMGELLAAGREGLQRVMVADWGAAAGADEHEPGVWQAASPHWDEQRAEEMALVAGSPGFAEQWLNIWPDLDDLGRWLPKRFTDAADGAAGRVPRDALVALDSTWTAHGDEVSWAAAFGWMDKQGRVVAKVARARSLSRIMPLLGQHRVHAHRSTVRQLEAQGRTGRMVEAGDPARQRAATEGLADLIRQGLLLVEGITDEEWAGVRVTASAAGQVIDAHASPVDVSAVTAVAWVAHAVRVAAATKPTLVV